MHSLKPAFTIVELIVVIVIIGILSMIGFVSYNGYLGGARDSNRISTMKGITDSLNLYATKNDHPFPEDYVTITASGTTVGYQGYAGANTLEIINYTNGGQDPKDKTYYTYYLTNDKKQFQLLGFLEEAENLETVFTSQNSLSFGTGLKIIDTEETFGGFGFSGEGQPLFFSFIPQTYAADYTNRFPKVYGKKLGVLTLTSTNIPLQEVTTGTFETNSSTENYTVYYSDAQSLTASGYTLTAFLNVYAGDKAPTDCPDGFIGVPGNPEFNRQSFCVAQYEMTYADADIPDSCGEVFPTPCTGYQDYNTARYQPGKSIVSMAGKYPIVNITQLQAINACKSMGEGYHLITNNEWMTIARNIEANPKNWSSGTVGQGNLWNGVSNNTTFGCNATGGNIEATPGRIFATKTGPGNPSCNPRRSHILRNGQTIWDMSGNVWEHVNKANTIDGSGYNTGRTSATGTTSDVDWDNDGIYALLDMQKYGSAHYKGQSSGMGNISYSSGRNNNILVRGLYANFGQYAGIYQIDFFQVTSTIERQLGFRCAR